MNKTKEYLRFALPQRIEHWVMVISFTVLAVTGLPQKFAGDGWAETMISLMGGIEWTRIIHHTAAIVLLLGAVYHFIVLMYKVTVTRVRWTMFPQLQDAMDALNSVLYNLGKRKEAPKYDRFSFGEKFEYWALIWGTIVMAVTGFMLWNPIITSRFVSGEVIPAAKAAHGGEAILAVLSVLVWHFYNVHLKSLNKAMFTGKLSEHEMEEEHGLELERLESGKLGRTTEPNIIRRRQRIYFPIAAVLSLGFLFVVFLFTTAETTAVTTIRRQAGAIVTVYSPQTPTATPRKAALPAQTGGIPALPADHAGRSVCQACHESGIAGAPKSPPDHAGRLDGVCQDCHKPQGAAGSGGNQAGGIPAIPADHAGRTTCQSCHESGTGGAPKNPADHAGRADNTCASCHQPEGGSGSGVAAAPNLPAGHYTGGCAACHATGASNAPKWPDNHATFTESTCSSCHKP